MQHGGFDPIKALAYLRKTFTHFLPQRICILPQFADFAFQTFLDIDQQIPILPIYRLQQLYLKRPASLNSILSP
jgi:hypothetical protein